MNKEQIIKQLENLKKYIPESVSEASHARVLNEVIEQRTALEDEIKALETKLKDDENYVVNNAFYDNGFLVGLGLGSITNSTVGEYEQELSYSVAVARERIVKIESEISEKEAILSNKDLVLDKQKRENAQYQKLISENQDDEKLVGRLTRQLERNSDHAMDEYFNGVKRELDSLKRELENANSELEKVISSQSEAQEKINAYKNRPRDIDELARRRDQLRLGALKISLDNLNTRENNLTEEFVTEIDTLIDDVKADKVTNKQASERLTKFKEVLPAVVLTVDVDEANKELEKNKEAQSEYNKEIKRIRDNLKDESNYRLSEIDSLAKADERLRIERNAANANLRYAHLDTEIAAISFALQQNAARQLESKQNINNYDRARINYSRSYRNATTEEEKNTLVSNVMAIKNDAEAEKKLLKTLQTEQAGLEAQLKSLENQKKTAGSIKERYGALLLLSQENAKSDDIDKIALQRDKAELAALLAGVESLKNREKYLKHATNGKGSIGSEIDELVEDLNKKKTVKVKKTTKKKEVKAKKVVPAAVKLDEPKEEKDDVLVGIPPIINLADKVMYTNGVEEADKVVLAPPADDVYVSDDKSEEVDEVVADDDNVIIPVLPIEESVDKETLAGELDSAKLGDDELVEVESYEDADIDEKEINKANKKVSKWIKRIAVLAATVAALIVLLMSCGHNKKDATEIAMNTSDPEQAIVQLEDSLHEDPVEESDIEVEVEEPVVEEEEEVKEEVEEEPSTVVAPATTEVPPATVIPPVVDKTDEQIPPIVDKTDEEDTYEDDLEEPEIIPGQNETPDFNPNPEPVPRPEPGVGENPIPNPTPEPEPVPRPEPSPGVGENPIPDPEPLPRPEPGVGENPIPTPEPVEPVEEIKVVVNPGDTLFYENKDGDVIKVDLSANVEEVTGITDAKDFTELEETGINNIDVTDQGGLEVTFAPETIEKTDEEKASYKEDLKEKQEEGGVDLEELQQILAELEGLEAESSELEQGRNR